MSKIVVTKEMVSQGILAIHMLGQDIEDIDGGVLCRAIYRAMRAAAPAQDDALAAAQAEIERLRAALRSVSYRLNGGYDAITKGIATDVDVCLAAPKP